MNPDNSSEELEIIEGFVDHVVYRNDDNGYTVFSLDSDTTVTGYFPSIGDGDSLRLRGNFTFHPTYGEQFNAVSFEVMAPKDEDDIRRYLSSGAIKGIGPALAGRIVDKFGADTFDIIENQPELLAKVRGISEKKAMEIADRVLEKTRDRSAILFLLQYGIKNALAVKIYKYYGTDVYRILQTNPYKLAEDIRGVGFKLADEIAGRLGIGYDSDHRIRSGILYILSNAAAAGHTYILRETLDNHCKSLLAIEGNPIDANLMALTIDKKIVMRGEKIWLSYFYNIEQESALMLLGLDVEFEDDRKGIEDFLEGEEDEEFELDEKQKEALFEIQKRGVMVLTGGPGTGKTTTIRTIIGYFESLGSEISLCAPTGRAAKRMTESTGRPAMTIHRLLEVSGGMDDDERPDAVEVFGRNRDYPLETDMVIVDEASMVDMSLFHALLRAIPVQTRLVLVGDANQLPSVGAGNVLRDIIDSEKFSVVRLVNIFRQKTRSDIVINAHKIQSGEEISLDNDSKDFFFLKRYDARELITSILTLIKHKLPGYVDADSFDIQVLTPTRKGNLGVTALNAVLQKYLNPQDDNKDEQTVGDRIFRVGDKVMQIKNDYSLPWRIVKRGYSIEEGSGVYNGDIGRVKEINKFAKIVTVIFDDEKQVEYSYKQLEELEHAYAVTVHKSQGSEYPAVIIPLMNVPRMLINRNLIYTAITRAKKCVVLLGEEQIFNSMVQNDTILKRYSGFKDAILIHCGEDAL